MWPRHRCDAPKELLFVDFVTRKALPEGSKLLRGTRRRFIANGSLPCFEFIEKPAMKLAEPGEKVTGPRVEATERGVVDLILLRQVSLQNRAKASDCLVHRLRSTALQGRGNSREQWPELAMLLDDAYFERVLFTHSFGRSSVAAA